MSQDHAAGSSGIYRIPVIGKIRSGTKRLAQKAASNQQLSEIWNRRSHEGMAPREIEEEIRTKTGADGFSVPTNTQHFNCYAADFVGGKQTTDLLMRLFGEDRGEGIKLYQFPAIIPVDSFSLALPHNLRCWGSTGLKFWSETDESGDRFCMARQNPTVDPKSRRARRQFGPRQIVSRGLCSPEDCEEYQAKACNLQGSLVVQIPGLPGSGFVEIPTSSIYTIKGWREALWAAKQACGTFEGRGPTGAPIFWLTKQRKELSRLDDSGRQKKTKHWIPVLEMRAPLAMLEPHPATTPSPAGHVVSLDRYFPIPSTPEEMLASIRKIIAAVGVSRDEWIAIATRKWGAQWNHNKDHLWEQINVLKGIAADGIKGVEAVEDQVSRRLLPF